MQEAKRLRLGSEQQSAEHAQSAEHTQWVAAQAAEVRADEAAAEALRSIEKARTIAEVAEAQCASGFPLAMFCFVLT